MAVVRKFLFDNDFGAPETPASGGASGAASAPAGAKGGDKAVGKPLSRPEPQRPAPPPIEVQSGGSYFPTVVMRTSGTHSVAAPASVLVQGVS